IGSNGRAGKHLDVAEIFTQALDHDFIFADHLFDYDANLPPGHVHDHHAEEPIDRLDRFKPQDSVEPHDFGDNVANFCKLFAADLFDLVGLQAANLLHESQRHCEHVFATADEERLRDDEGQRHFQSKARAPALFGVHLDLAIQLHHVRTHYVEAHTASGQFALAGSSREAGMEKEVQQVLLAQIGRSIGADETVFDCRLADLFVIDAPAIVFNFYINVVAAMISAHGYVSMVALARLVTYLFPFDAMGHVI